jgi:hypothetical protein
MSTGERPLGDVLARTPRDFTPDHAERRPWVQPRPVNETIASTGNREVVRLDQADRVHLHGLGAPSWLRGEYDEPTDWMPVGWGVPPA